MRRATLNGWSLLALLLSMACSAPRTAGKTIGRTYHAPSSHWSVDFPLDPSLQRVEDQQFPSQENVLFAPSVPIGLGIYQIAVTHSEPALSAGRRPDKEQWFEQLTQHIAQTQGQTPRLIADEHVPENASGDWMRIYLVGERYELFLLRRLPALNRDGGPGAVLFSLSCTAREDRPRIGEARSLSLPLHRNWARLVEWSESFVWQASLPADE